MARRPVFVPAPHVPGFVRLVWIDLVWHPGFAVTQKKRNIHALHEGAATVGLAPILETSTKSDHDLGQHLSAFHLKVSTARGPIPLEAAYQGSKVFEAGGPFWDLYSADARTAKRDPRLRDSGKIVGFNFQGTQFPIEPKTVFYDWLYVNAIFNHRDWLRDRLPKFAGFTDIEFNPERSINCQARSCALFTALLKSDLLEDAVQSPERFIILMSQDPQMDRPTQSNQAPRLF